MISYRKLNPRLLAYITLTLAAVCFSASVIVIKNLVNSSTIPGTEIAFFRFAIGFAILAIIQLVLRINIKPQSLPNVLERGMSHGVAVIVFYITITIMSAIKANLYNMTYTIFIGIIAHYMLKEKLTPRTIAAIFLGMLGAIAILDPGKIEGVPFGDILGLASGLVSGYAMVTLKKARTTDNTFTIMYYLMGTGTLMTGMIMLYRMTTPTPHQAASLVIIALLSLAAQYLMTHGYRYVTSLEGAIILDSQIFIVPILSICFLGEQLTLPIIIGAILIFASIIVLNLRSK